LELLYIFYFLWTDLYVTYAKSDLPAEILSVVLKLKTLKQIIKGKWDSSANTPFCSFRLATVTFKKATFFEPGFFYFYFGIVIGS